MNPSTVPRNPLKEIRLANNLTLDSVAFDLRTTRQYLIRVEQGVYAAPPERYTNYLLDLSVPESITDRAVGLGMTDELVVYHLYREFQRATRKKNFGKLLTDYDFGYKVGALHEHPFTSWRWASGIRARIGVSKMFCVHPALISKFESSPNLCASPPGDLLLALSESGYSKELIDSFVKAYDTYKDDLSTKFRSRNG